MTFRRFETFAKQILTMRIIEYAVLVAQLFPIQSPRQQGRSGAGSIVP